MNFGRLTLFFVTATLLSSCSQLQKTVRGGDQLRLTKADPSRFLPARSQAKKIRTAQLLAKNEKAPTRKSKKDKPSDLDSFPSLELPTLPAASADDQEFHPGILPSLDDTDGPTSIEVDGETPELPPLPTPEELLIAEEAEQSS